MKVLEKLIMAVVAQLYAPTVLSPKKRPPVLNGEEAGWAPEPVWELWRRETSCPCREFNPDRGPIAVMG
jgi:hypothetical protein